MNAEAVIQDYLALTGHLPQTSPDPPTYGNVYISLYTPESFSPSAYELAYSKLQRWIENSLDVFKVRMNEKRRGGLIDHEFFISVCEFYVDSSCSFYFLLFFFFRFLHSFSL
ncbi:hypothetical protein HMI55_004809 [Coelomomyces lativittatus]|nr:hypothetical protein HMI55_004809 [Coelomomyces lativittatus]